MEVGMRPWKPAAAVAFEKRSVMDWNCCETVSRQLIESIASMIEENKYRSFIETMMRLHRNIDRLKHTYIVIEIVTRKTLD